MANIEIPQTKKSIGVKRLIKKPTKVDLTPMVDLGFLLITFFVFTSELSKPKFLGIVSPKESIYKTNVCESCVITMILTAENKIKYYEGIPKQNTILLQTDYSEAGLRNILLQKRASVMHKLGSADNLVIIVKPSDDASFKNFIDIIDEVAINNIKHYFIDEITELDKKLLANKL